MNEGGSQTFYITPAAGHMISNVTVDGGGVGAVSSYTFVGVAAGHTISATFNNPSPSASAGPDQIVFEGTTVQLNGSASSDSPARAIATFAWSQTAGPAVVLSNTASPTPTFVAPGVASDSVLTFRLTITDDGGLVATDDVQVMVKDNGLTGFAPPAIPFRASNGLTAAVKSVSGGAIVGLSPVNPNTIADNTGRPTNLPYGLFNTVIKTNSVGGAAVITFGFSTPVSSNIGWFKHSLGAGWLDLSGQVVVSPDGTEAAVQLTDGGVEDADGVANGIIVDPSGPGNMDVPQVITLNVPAGTAAADYRIVAVPLLANQLLPADLLGPQIGAYDTTLMRIAVWNADTQAFVEYPGFNQSMVPGVAAWYLFRYGKSLRFEGFQTPTVQGPAAPGSAGFQQGYWFTLKPGWNMIGNPFNFGVNITNNFIVRQGVNEFYLNNVGNTITQQVFWTWSNTLVDYEAASALNIGGGGWIKNLTASDCELFVPAVEAAARELGVRLPRAVTDGLDKPPAPPGTLESGTTGGGGGGGGGGCFVQTVGRPWAGGIPLVFLALLPILAVLARRR